MKTFSLPSITMQPVSNAGESDFGLSVWSQAFCGKELMSVYKHLRPISLVHSPFLIYQKNSIKCLTFLESLCECVRIYGEGNSQISSLEKSYWKQSWIALTLTFKCQNECATIKCCEIYRTMIGRSSVHWRSLKPGKNYHLFLNSSWSGISELMVYLQT